MKRFIGIMGVLITPLAFFVYLTAMLITLPLVAILSLLQALNEVFSDFIDAISELFGLRNNIAFMQKWLEKCYVLMGEK